MHLAGRRGLTASYQSLAVYPASTYTHNPLFPLPQSEICVIRYPSPHLARVENTAKGAYLQGGPIEREIYLGPQRECESWNRGKIWHLARLPYGMAEAGRQRAVSIELRVAKDVRLDRIFGVSQCSVRWGSNCKVLFFLVKLTDDVLISGSVDFMSEFVLRIKERFNISNFLIDLHINFNGCTIRQDPAGNMPMSMKEYLESIKCIYVSKERRRDQNLKAKREEYDAY